ncbi:hypothetical protein GJ744_007437 [Endocarpon pusillum]|uniref:Uncharacterized protein n=1 Tax=Endocarpon pusillum TaxID=364733 RepID=A0A8H7E564_9EURO|nr:hypothetical protein GJ744_007437 [Endocarpon pusillum]
MKQWKLTDNERYALQSDSFPRIEAEIRSTHALTPTYHNWQQQPQSAKVRACISPCRDDRDYSRNIMQLNLTIQIVIGLRDRLAMCISSYQGSPGLGVGAPPARKRLIPMFGN